MAGIKSIRTPIFPKARQCGRCSTKTCTRAAPSCSKVRKTRVQSLRNAFWLIHGNIFPKPNGKGSFRLITPSASKLEILARRYSFALPRDDRHSRPDARHGQTRRRHPGGVSDAVSASTSPTMSRSMSRMARAYNRFIAQACAKSGGRIRWVVVPPLHSIEELVKEIKWAKDNGAVGVFFRGIEGQRTLDNPYFNPIYQAASDTDLPVLIHTGAGCPLFSIYSTWNETTPSATAVCSRCSRFAT